MAFAASRNRHLEPRFRDIARYYRLHGDRWRVRWDYAFFQMLVETNYLTFRKPGGARGDVYARQNNFAGLGATGGVPGDSFPNVSAGVLAQIQHLVVYSGERVEHPTAPRTRLKMDEILARSRMLDRAMTYHDLAGRWAADRRYGHTIEATAIAFRQAYCGGPMVSDSFPLWSRMSALWPGPGRSEASREPARGGNREDGGTGRAEKRVTQPSRRVSHTLGTNRKNPEPRAAKGGERPSEATSSAPPAISVTARTPAAVAEKSAAPVSPPPVTQTASAPPAKSAQPETSLPPPAQRSAEAAPAATPPSPAPAAPAASKPEGQAQAAEPPAARMAAAAPPPERPQSACKIFRASYGGPKTVLIEAQKDQTTHLTVLGVTAGKEKEQAKAFIDAHARGGRVIGEFPLETEALKKSFELCPGG